MTRSTSSSAGFTNGNSTCENNRPENNGHCSVNEIEPMGASYRTLNETSFPLQLTHLTPNAGPLNPSIFWKLKSNPLLF